MDGRALGPNERAAIRRAAVAWRDGRPGTATDILRAELGHVRALQVEAVWFAVARNRFLAAMPQATVDDLVAPLSP